MAHFPKAELSFPAGGSEVDPFGRLRVSENHILLSSQLNYDLLPLVWDQSVVGGGSSVAHLSDESSALLTVGTNTNDRVVRQTKRYWLYRAGQGQAIALTFADLSNQTSIRKRVGYFDDDDGIFLEVVNGQIAIVKRSSTSGSPVDTRVLQSSWNLDKLDGSGPSGVSLDITKTQILLIDLQWLGVGSVRVGFDIGEKRIYVHAFEHANIETVVYMKSGSLPVRYEIESLAISSGGSMKQICSSVVREGGTEETGSVACASNGITSVSASTTAQTSLHLRLRSSHIRAFLRPLAVAIANVGNSDVYWRLVLNGTLSGSPTFSGHSTAGEVATDLLTYTEGTGTVVGCGVVPAQGSSKSALSEAVAPESILGVAADIAGVSDILSLVVQVPNATSDVYTSLTYLELL
jgi:hypothetical protein